MADGQEPPPGGGSDLSQSNILSLDQRTTTSAWADGSVPGRKSITRSFEQIVEDEKKERNILEIVLQKLNVVNDDGSVTKPKSLTFEDIGELLFDVLLIKPEDCVSFNFSSGRYDLREVKFKPGVSTLSYVTGTPIEFKHHLVNVRQQKQNVTRVTFKNVPLNVPDEEILNLCNCYGKPVENIVHYETLRNIKGRNLKGSTRFVDMNLDEGKYFRNYYWMEGPLPGDVGKRIVVLHHGQVTQCSHCLRAAGGCQAMGIGKICEQMGTPRERMTTYMQALRSNIGYVSLKIQHIEKQAQMFPSLIGIPGEKSSEQEVEGAWAMREDGNNLNTDVSNPTEERDQKLIDQNKQIESLLGYKNKVESLEKNLEEMKEDNLKMKKKLTFTKRAAEERIFENVTNKESYRDDPFLVAVYSASLNEDDINTESNEICQETSHISRREQFLQSLDSKLDSNDEIQKERLAHVKLQVLEKLKTTKERSLSNKRRLSEIGIELSDRSNSKPRTTSPHLNDGE